MPLDPTKLTGDIQKWAGLLSLGIDLGTSAFNGIKALMRKEGLSDAEINAAEAAAVEDSRRRQAEREEMGRASGES